MLTLDAAGTFGSSVHPTQAKVESPPELKTHLLTPALHLTLLNPGQSSDDQHRAETTLP